MKTLKKALAIVLTLCSLATFFSVGAWAVEPASETKYETVTVGGAAKQVTVTPSDGWNATAYHWYENPYGWDDGAVYMPSDVSSPTITFSGKTAGKATLRCNIDCVSVADPNSTGTKYVDVVVTVLPAALTYSVSGADTLSINPATGVCDSALYTIEPYSNISSVSWNVSNGTGQATFDPYTGKLTAVKAGTVTLNASVTDDMGRIVAANSKTVTITETQLAPEVPIVSIYIDNPGKVFSGTTVQLKAVVNGNYSTDVKWSIIDGAGLAEVNSTTGVLTVYSASYGRRVTVKAESIYNAQKYDTKGIDIIAPYVEISSSNGTSLASGQTTLLTAVNYPFGSQSGWTWAFTDTSFENYAELTWDGSNKSTLKIKNTGVSISVRATDSNGVSATITINTTSAPTPTPTSSTAEFRLSNYAINMKAGTTYQLYAYLDNTDVTSITSWASNDTKIATVVNGKITAKSAGTTTIIASNEVGSTKYYETCTVTVTGSVITHQITYGNYGTFDGTNPLYFITNDYISNFTGVAVDGYALANGTQYYSTSSSDGHILIALNPAYLKMLSSSNYHTIQIVSTNGTATGYFRNYGVSYNIYGVRTGDDNNIALWVTLCIIGFAGAAAIVIKKRKDIFG